ncbi:unnamed protein product, partial [Iphiclides podalirius]
MIARKYLQKLSKDCIRWASTVTKPPSTLAPQFCAEFNDYFPKILDKALNESKYIDHPLLKDKIRKMNEHFMLSKFPIQAEFFFFSYELLENPENITSDKLRQAYLVACASELVQIYFLFHDDLYDNSETRAGKPCWHLTPDASRYTLNDTVMLRGFINELLHSYLEPSLYREFIDVFNEMFLGLAMGQYLDLLVPATKDYNSYTMETYEKITYLKASVYSMNSPMLLALVMANKGSEESLQLVRKMCNNLGVLFQIHNDLTEYMDVDQTMTLKSNTDIINGKCAWTAVAALKHFNAEQRKIFDECYKSSDPEKIKRVLRLYDEVNLRDLYRKEEKARYDVFLEKVSKLPADSVPSPDFFMGILRAPTSIKKDSLRQTVAKDFRNYMPKVE